MKIPVSISPSPIIGATLELRFLPEGPTDAVFGMLYQQLREQYRYSRELPVAKIPADMVDEDADLQFRGHYLLENENCTLEIGPRVVVLGSRMPYVGWSVFQKEIQQVTQALHSLNIVKRYERFGLRYINYFEGNLWDNLTLQIQSELEFLTTNIRFLTRQEQFVNSVVISDNIVFEDAPDRKGTVLDLDTFLEASQFYSSSEVVQLIDQMHRAEKYCFFKLLKLDYLYTLNPTYA